jgi:hypothetical protein
MELTKNQFINFYKKLILRKKSNYKIKMTHNTDYWIEVSQDEKNNPNKIIIPVG